jgi:hypothetical protein
MKIFEKDADALPDIESFVKSASNSKMFSKV